MSRKWKIVVVVVVVCVAAPFVYLAMMGRLVDVMVRMVGAMGKLGHPHR